MLLAMLLLPGPKTHLVKQGNESEARHTEREGRDPLALDDANERHHEKESWR